MGWSGRHGDRVHWRWTRSLSQRTSPLCDHSEVQPRGRAFAHVASCTCPAVTLTTLSYSLLSSKRAGVTCLLFSALALSSSMCLVYGNKNRFVLKSTWNKAPDPYSSKLSGSSNTKPEKPSQPRGASRDMKTECMRHSTIYGSQDMEETPVSINR